MKENNNGNDSDVGSIENSIEEDITKINTYIELVLEKDYCNCNELNEILGKHCDGSKNIAYAMQHILSAYRRVLKENEELKNKLDNSRKANEFLNRKNDEIRREKSVVYSKAVNDIINGWNLGDDFIPVQKVKDKIEEIQKEYNKLDKEVDEYINDANKDLSKYYENKEKIGEMQILSWCINNLQELLQFKN